MKKSHHFVMLSNISVEPFFVPALRDVVFNKKEIDGNITYIPFQEYRKIDYRDILKEATVVIVWINLEILLPEMHQGICDNSISGCQYKEQKAKQVQSLCHEVAEYISLYAHAKILWLLFEDYFLHLPVVTGHRMNLFTDQINQNLVEGLHNEITFIDLKYLIAELGIRMAFSTKNKFRWSFPYSKALVEAVAVEVQKQYFIENGISKKCLVLDCDNVLWGGILSEDGIDNIKLGSSGLGWEYQEFQRFVLSLYYRGVILAISSKNDLADVLKVFREHSGMILKEDHITCFQVNWENKSNNIRKIAEKLNVGTESIVFIDDSSFELEAVKSILPEVVTIQYHRDRMYEVFSCFNLKENLDFWEVLKRNDTYRTEVHRREIKEKSNSFSDYLSALEMKVDIHEVLPAEYARVAELTQRTNKCTNGIRCTVSDIKKWAADKDIHLYTVTLADKFSNMGLVGALGMQDRKLILFSLSCRALGRDVEYKMLRYIQERYLVTDFDFIDTGKNRNLKMLFEEMFFK